MSMTPTVESGFTANACARRVVNVDFPTPPLPDKTRILCRICERRSVIIGISGSGPLGADAQIFWFGQPAQASLRPACSDSGPGQCSEGIVRCNFGRGHVHTTEYIPGSGATRFIGAFLACAAREASMADSSA